MHVTKDAQMMPLLVGGSLHGDGYAFTGAESVGALVEHLVRQNEASRPPANPEELLASGWRDYSTQKAKLYMALEPKRNDDRYARIRTCIKLKTEDQVASFPLIEANGRSLAGGAVPIYLMLDTWHLWFPFCEKCQLLKTISTFESVWLQTYKIGPFTCDCVVFVAFRDQLDAEGCLEIIMRSPYLPAEEERFLGISIPGCTSWIRTQLLNFRLAVYPTSRRHADVIFQAELYDNSNMGISWIMVKAWQALSMRIVPMIAKMQAGYAGSAMERHHNSGDWRSADLREKLLACHERVVRFVESEERAGRLGATIGVVPDG